MGSFYAALSKGDKEKVDKWVETRENPQYDRDIPQDFFLAAELGFFYGWEAVRDFNRGFIEKNGPNGEKEYLGFTYEDAVAYVEAAKKVRYIYATKGYATPRGHLRPNQI